MQATLQEALQLSQQAEAKFRGEAWGNPAMLYMDVVEAARRLSLQGCTCRSVEDEALKHVQRVAKEGASQALLTIPCWSDAVQQRFVELTAS